MPIPQDSARTLPTRGRRRLRTLLLACCALLVLPLLTSAATVPARSAPARPAAAAPITRPPAADSFTVSGAVGKPLTLTTGDLRHYRGQRAWVRFQTSTGTERHSFRGARLVDVLTDAAPKFNPANKNDKLSFSVLVTAADGYRALVSWGEFDPDFGDGGVLLAYEQDHRRLDRPRLVVPGDGKGGRYVTGVSDVNLRAAGY